MIMKKKQSFKIL